MRRADSPLGESLNKDTSFPVFTDLKAGSPLSGLKEVGDGLVVDLEVRGTHHEGSVLVGFMLDVLEYFLHGAGNNAALRVRLEVLKTLHSESLARARLTVG